MEVIQQHMPEHRQGLRHWRLPGPHQQMQAVTGSKRRWHGSRNLETGKAIQQKPCSGHGMTINPSCTHIPTCAGFRHRLVSGSGLARMWVAAHRA